MTEWYEVPYKGGPMVAVKGFPRPLYPPDAAAQGKTPSINGPDVEAYKRTVSRAQRWKWQAFDQSYSNGFSHGKGPNVIDSGVAGIQRQQKIDPTGWIGTGTFNTLRSIRVPEGFAHAGEMAMDARAVELINAAWDMFGGKEPTAPTTPVTTSAQERLRMAKSQVGISESPPRSNMQKYGAWYGVNGVPWCAIFCTWCDQTGKNPSGTFKKGTTYAYVPYVVNDARLGKNGLSITGDPKPGDLVCFDWDRNGEFDHIGLFDSWATGRQFWSVEGNTSDTDNSNGGSVMRRQRDAGGAARVVFCRVKE